MTIENARIYANARARLSLPPLSRATVTEFNEAVNCIGCTARYDHNNVYVVHVVPGCPSHGAQPRRSLHEAGHKIGARP